ncbi:uracil-DNA glycosylase family protein [Zhouia sp. PK063]|uniref:uracil-DNA glycosylase family protein n=1 Tax=Zhouia sp. PK063 TaxID=3373602 RepID=UPI00378DE105
MFLHQHPYQPFFPTGVTKLIVGTLPPPRFTTRDLKEGDVDFCYGSRDGQLWQILNRIFNLQLKFETTEEAIRQRIDFLTKNKIGICDAVEYCYREKVDASDIGMQQPVCRDLISYLKQYSTINTLLFTGGNSKNGPEYFFRKILKEHDLKLRLVALDVPKIHEFELDSRIIKTVSLTAPSGAANRAVGSIPLYKELKQKYPEFTTIDFRVLQYERFFKN